MYLFFDVETTGFYNKALIAKDPNQSRIVQLAAILTDKKLNTVSSMSVVFKPVNFNISAGAAKIHGYTNEIANEVGVESKPAMTLFGQFVDLASDVIAYNAVFDTKVYNVEMGALDVIRIIPDHKIFCPMLHMTPICQLAHARRSTFKRPKLSEAYEFCHKRAMLHAHDALSDVRATIDVCRWIRVNAAVGTPFAK